MYGKRQSKYSINKMKKSKSGNNNPSFGSCWIYNINLKQTKKIHKSDIHEYEDWDLGRKMKFD
jgi:hypothetical protein